MQITKPEVSIIIPIHNAEVYLDHCLLSVKQQTFSIFEVICIDDGSSDNSLQILSKYANLDSRFKIHTQKNKGPASARNKGLLNSNGKYIMFCDADDSYNRCMVEKMYNAITQEDADIVMCENSYSSELPESCDERIKGENDYFKIKIVGKEILTEKSLKKINILLWNKIFKKSLIDKYDIKFPNGHKADDNAFVNQYLYVAKTYYGLQEKLYHRIYHRNSISDKLYSDKFTIKKLDGMYSVLFTLDFLYKHNLHNVFFNSVCDNLNSEFNFCLGFCENKEKKEFVRKWLINKLFKLKGRLSLSNDNLLKYDFIVNNLIQKPFSENVFFQLNILE